MSLIQFLGKDRTVISSQTARAKNQICWNILLYNEDKNDVNMTFANTFNDISCKCYSRIKIRSVTQAAWPGNGHTVLTAARGCLEFRKLKLMAIKPANYWIGKH